MENTQKQKQLIQDISDFIASWKDMELNDTRLIHRIDDFAKEQATKIRGGYDKGTHLEISATIHRMCNMIRYYQ